MPVDNPQQTREIDALAQEFTRRCRRGEQPSIDEYVAAHPDLADAIEELFPAIVAMEQLKTPADCSVGKAAAIEKMQRIGEFRLVREIGRGGMGIVFQAEQESLSRFVALKVFPEHAHLSPQRLERFRREAQTAAKLHHTHIVPVYGVGEDSGLSYFVMQYVPGIGVDRVIDELRLLTSDEHVSDENGFGNEFTPRRAASALISGTFQKPHGARQDRRRGARIDTRDLDRRYWESIAHIIAQAADALDYAHGQGVVHRDIKPGNLLLDSEGKVWITDFGLAKAVHHTDLSKTGDIVGTLRYMAPEQFRRELDPAADIYSLGLTLYELLTLRPAFDETDPDQVMQGASPTSPRKLNAAIPRDLETIVLKATAIEPRHRYKHGRALANDLRRFTEDRPIKARRANAAEKLWRWSRRNPMLASMSSALLLVLITGFALVSWKWREAEAENRRAEQNLSIALDSINEFLDRYVTNWMARPVESNSGLDSLSGEPRMVVNDESARILQSALRFYKQFSNSNAAHLRPRREIARVHRCVGDIRRRLGQFELAENAYGEAIACYLRLTANTRDSKAIQEAASTLNAFGSIKRMDGRFAEAARAFLDARRLLSKQLLRDPRSAACRFELALTEINLGGYFGRNRTLGASEASRQRAGSLLRELTAESPGNPDYKLALARLYRSLQFSAGFYGPGRTEPSAHRDNAISLLEELVKSHPDVPDYRCELAETLVLVARPLDAAKMDEYAGQQRRAVDLARELADEFKELPRYQACLAHANQALAVTLRTARKLTEAKKHQLAASAIYDELARRFRTIGSYQKFNVWTRMSLVETLQKLGETSAIAKVRQELAQLQQTVGDGPWDPAAADAMAPYHRELALTLFGRKPTTAEIPATPPADAKLSSRSESDPRPAKLARRPPAASKD